MIEKKTVLITGAGGLIGSLLRATLADTYAIRSVSLEPIPGAETIVSSITDLGAMQTACRGVDSIIHLAASASPDASWEEVLPNNIIGTYTVFEAAHLAGVPQVIFASSNHTVAGYDLEKAPDIYRTGEPRIDHTVPVRPGNLYGVSKCFGEALGRYYADHLGMRVICLRIGAINPADHPYFYEHEDQERLGALWLSHRDMVQLVRRCLEADRVKFGIFYGISNNTNPRSFYDLQHAREVIGYVPLDGCDQPPPLLSS